MLFHCYFQSKLGNDILNDIYVTRVLLWLYIWVLKLVSLYIMIVYDVLNDTWNAGNDIYVYYQDIDYLYQYLMSINCYYIPTSQI